MTLVEVIDTLQTWIRNADDEYDREEMGRVAGLKEALHEIKKIEPCEMTAEEYRQRMIQAFHNADTDELIAVCVLPTEKEFEHLEWLLKNHYKKELCEDAISREAVDTLVDELARAISDERCGIPRGRSTATIMQDILDLPPVTPQPKTGHWIPVSERLPEEKENPITRDFYQYPCTAKFDDNYDIRYYKFGNGHWWHGPGIMDEYVMAWMSLPEPYKAEKEE